MFFKSLRQRYIKPRVYLDYASSTPLDERMLGKFPRIAPGTLAANPSALHGEGVALKQVLTDARRRVATVLGAHTDEIVFTGSATESDALAVVGAVENARMRGIPDTAIEVWTSPFEHSAVTESLAHIGGSIAVRVFDQDAGVVVPASLVPRAGTQCCIVSVLYVQNEIGTVQPIKEIAKQVRKLRKEHAGMEVIFHTDATQAPLFADTHVLRLGVDLMTLGATKLYCPKGVGVLYKKRTVTLEPLYFGGGQEFGLRPGTEPVALIDTFARSLEYAQQHSSAYRRRTEELQQYTERLLEETFPHVRITAQGSQRAPHITHVAVPGFESELLVLELDARGVAVSSKSACKNEDTDESGVLTLMYPGQPLGAIRISYGRSTTKRDCKRFVAALQAVFEKYRSVYPNML